MRVSAQSFRGAATDDSFFARQQCPVVATVCPALLIKFFTQNLPVTIAWDEKLRCAKLPLRNFWVLWFYLFFLYFCCLPIFSSGRSVTQFLSLLKLLFLLFYYSFTDVRLVISVSLLPELELGILDGLCHEVDILVGLVIILLHWGRQRLKRPVGVYIYKTYYCHALDKTVAQIQANFNT